MKSTALALSLLLLLAAAGAYAAMVAYRAYNDPMIVSIDGGAAGSKRVVVLAEAERQATEPFMMTDQDEQQFSTEDLRGKVWVGNFFFSTCPSTCFRLMSEMSKLQKEFADEGVHFVSVTVDPKTDTPAALKEYAKRFGADHDHWTFLTGPLEETSQIGLNVFKLPMAEQTHSDKAAIMDREGRFAAAFNLLKPEEAELMRSTLRKVLKEKSTADGQAATAAAQQSTTRVAAQ